jgi:hypothetical protein
VYGFTLEDGAVDASSSMRPRCSGKANILTINGVVVEHVGLGGKVLR